MADPIEPELQDEQSGKPHQLDAAGTQEEGDPLPSEDDARLREWASESKKSNPGRKARKFKAGRRWLSLVLVLFILAVIGGIAYLDFKHTNYVIAPGPQQTFDRYRTAVKEKRWADAYTYFSTNHMGNINRCCTINKDNKKSAIEAFVIQMEDVNYLGGKDVLFWDIDVVNVGTFDHFDEATETAFIKSPEDYRGYAFSSNVRPGYTIEFKMIKTSAGWKIDSQSPMASGNFRPPMPRR